MRYIHPDHCKVSKSKESAGDEATDESKEPAVHKWNYACIVSEKVYCHCEKGCDECTREIPVPFIDLPMSTAAEDVFETALVEPCRSGSPDLCLLYLQYGAMPVHPYVPPSSSYLSELECQPINVLLNAINQTVISCRKKHMRPGDPKDLGLIGHVIGELTGHFLCLRYLLRADPFLRFDVRKLYGDSDASLVSDSAYTKLVLHTTLDRRLRDRFLPACLTEPVRSLQHQCRYVIRRAMRRNHKLSKGVFDPSQKTTDEAFKGKIPKHLLEFLELTVD